MGERERGFVGTVIASGHSVCEVCDQMSCSLTSQANSTGLFMFKKSINDNRTIKILLQWWHLLYNVHTYDNRVNKNTYIQIPSYNKPIKVKITVSISSVVQQRSSGQVSMAALLWRWERMC